MERGRDDPDIVETYVANATLNSAYVSAVQARLEGELLLRKAALLANPSNIVRKSLPQLHGPSGAPMYPIDLQPMSLICLDL